MFLQQGDKIYFAVNLVSVPIGAPATRDPR